HRMLAWCGYPAARPWSCRRAGFSSYPWQGATLKTPSHRPPRDLPRTFEELVRMHPPRAIHAEAEYEAVQEVIDRLTSLADLTQGQEEYLDTLTVLFEAYEKEHHAIETADLKPIDVLK